MPTFNFSPTVPIAASSFTAANTPHGILSRSESTISFDNTSRTFTMAPTGVSFKVYVSGKEYSFTTAQTTTITNTEGQWFIYFNASGVLTSSQTPWDLYTLVPVATLYWSVASAAHTILNEERHSSQRNVDWHYWAHTQINAQVESGFTLQNYTIVGNGSQNSHAQIGLTNGVLADEDIKTSITHSASPATAFQQILSTAAVMPVYYLSGAGSLIKKDTPIAYPVYDNAGANALLGYNQFTGGAWQITECPDNSYVAMWIIASPNRIVGESVFALLGQRNDSSLANAQANNQFSNLTFGSFAYQEFKVLYRLIFQTRSTYANAVKARLQDAQDLRRSTTVISTAALATNHASLSGLDYSSSGHTGFQKQTVYFASAPTADDDSANTSGNGLFTVGSIWINTASSNAEYVADSVAPGAAVWRVKTAGVGDVVGPVSAVDGNIVLFDGTTGKLIKDGLSVVTSIGATGFDTNIATEKAVRTAISAIPAGDVAGPSSSTDGNIVLFDGTTGKLIKDGLSVSTIISSGSSDTQVPTAKAVYDSLSVPAAFDVVTLNEKTPAPDATISTGKLYVLPATGIDSNTNLLLHLNFDPSVTDSSSNNITCTIKGTAALTSSLKKFGTGSLYLPAGNNRGIYTANSTIFKYGTGAFTLEGWVYFSSFGSNGDSAQWINLNNTSTDCAVQFDIYNNNGTIQLRALDNAYSSLWTAPTLTGLTINGWHHIAVSRLNTGTNNTNVYVDGTRIATPTLSTDIGTGSGHIRIGERTDAYGGPLSCYYDEIRVSNSQRYTTASFSVETSAFGSSTFNYKDAIGNTTTIAGSEILLRSNLPPSAASDVLNYASRILIPVEYTLGMGGIGAGASSTLVYPEFPFQTGTTGALIMHRSGTVCGLTVQVPTNVAAGSLTAKVYKTGVAMSTALDCTLSTASPLYTSKSVSAGCTGCTFVAGDYLEVRVTTTGDFSPTAAVTVANAYVVFDS